MIGKSGGWLNAVKVTLGFLELALALKFLSNADLSRNWRILDREVFLSLWIVIFILLGIYLLGKIKFHHDDELPKNDFDIPNFEHSLNPCFVDVNLISCSRSFHFYQIYQSFFV